VHNKALHSTAIPLRSIASRLCGALADLNLPKSGDTCGEKGIELFIERNCKMARFPRTETEVMDLAILRIALSQAMVSGLTGDVWMIWRNSPKNG